MKYTKYILFLVALIMVSCSIDDDFGKKGNTSKIQFACRVVPFNQHDVNTRAYGDVSENEIKTLDYIILAKYEDEYKCIYYKHSTNNIVTIDMSTDFYDLTHNPDGSENPGGMDLLKNCYVGIVANYPAIYNKLINDANGYSDIQNYIDDRIVFKGENPDNYVGAEYFTDVVQSVSEDLPKIGIPTTGLPRLGNYKDANGSSIINFAGLEGGHTYEVRLESLYAKMVFDITVTPTQEVVGQFGNTFHLDGYTVTNLAKTINLSGGRSSSEGTNDGTHSDVEVYTNSIDGAEESIDRNAESSRNVSFVCYLPERYTKVADDKQASIYSYPFLNGQPLRDEDKNLRQRYKPLLAEGINATYVTLKGTFVNHQGHSYDVSYDIYVGNDNYSNFDVVRNRQYNNSITIRGIENANDQSTNTTYGVAIDHRVDIQRSSPVVVNLRRETMLDSHFEVRPMRIRRSDAQDDSWIGKTLAVKVEIIDADVTGATTKTKADWIGLERSYGDGTPTSTGYCNSENNKSAKGKRKYFTTDLTKVDLATPVSELESLLGDANSGNNNGFSVSGGQAVIVPVTEAGECVWIYVDECDEDIPGNEARTEASVDLMANRMATIRVTNGYLGANNVWQPLVENEYTDYIIKQHKLYKVTYGSNTYCIEHEEEYLYNFDSEDTYTDNRTEFEGMPWGLDGVQLSDKHESIVITGSFDFIDDIKNNVLKTYYNPYYDFYTTKHDNAVMSTTANLHDRKGYDFTNEIVAKVNIGELALNENPNSAVEYCYNRNKRNSDGTIANVNWYMPAIDELEDIMMGAYSSFESFQDKFYWSSQAAYNRNFFHYSVGQKLLFWINQDQEGLFYTDNIYRARATKVNYAGGTYSYENSNTGGYYEIVCVDGAWIGDDRTIIRANLVDEFNNNGKYSYKYYGKSKDKDAENTKTFSSSDLQTFDRGVIERTNMARVRAVRKMN